MTMRILLIDNYDSYTYNLYQLLWKVAEIEPSVLRNDDPAPAWTGDEADAVVLSPGPGRPERPGDFGLCREALRQSALPTLGVCLGHQGLGVAYGASIRSAPEVRHGRLSPIRHVGEGLFAGIPQDFRAVRYHSLVVDPAGAEDLEQIAWTEDGLCMGLRHRHRPLWGVQFHPESLLTEHGERLISNFVELARENSKGALPEGPPSDGDPSLGHSSARPATTPRVSPRPDAIPAEPATGVRVHSRTLVGWVDPELVFEHLSRDAPQAFWLDSALALQGRARFSFMGTFPGGPMSELVSYERGGRLTVRSPDSSEQTLRRDLFSYLQERLNERRPSLLQTPSRDEALPDQQDAVSPDQQEAGLPFSFLGGWVGYLGYELKADFGGTAEHRSEAPDAGLLFADRFLAFDHLRREITLVGLSRRGEERQAQSWITATADDVESLVERSSGPLASRESSEPHEARRGVPYTLARDHARYMSDIDVCRRLLKEGETYEVCLTNTLLSTPLRDPLATYRRLRRLNPAPYGALLRLGELSVLSSSPERFLRVSESGWVQSEPIKGTAPRGATAAEDEYLRRALEVSEKDRAENLMIADLLRNDLGRVCEPGSIHVPSLMAIESYRSVHQMVTTVCGRLRPDLRALDCLGAAFPGGSMTGAPKLRTMEILDDLEDRARGPYSGAIGYLSVSGAADWSIVIRAIVDTPEAASIGAGGAIVVGSDPEAEFAEMLLKARAVLPALASVEDVPRVRTRARHSDLVASA